MFCYINPRPKMQTAFYHKTECLSICNPIKRCTFSHEAEADVLETAAVLHPNCLQPEFWRLWILESSLLQYGASLDELTGSLLHSRQQDPQRG